MNCNNPIVQNLLDKVIRDKCSKMFDEAMYIANDFNTLTKHKDLFIEQSTIYCNKKNLQPTNRIHWLNSTNFQQIQIPVDTKISDK